MKIPNGARITFRREFVRCGRKGCKVCGQKNSKGHGPYWYAYATVKGKFGKCYVGKSRAAWERAREGAPFVGNLAIQAGTADQRAMLARGATPKLAARILGVTPGANGTEVKAAFRRAIAVAHPDKGGNNTAAAAVLAAYNLIKRVVGAP